MTKKITDLQPQKSNANKHTEHGERLLRKSVQTYGIADGITIAANDEAISGSMRIETLADMMPDVKIQIVETYGDTLLVNKRMDIPSPDTKMGRALSVASNQVAYTDYSPDGEILKEWGNEDAAIKAMFAESEWTEITGEEKATVDAEPQIDRAAELLEKWKVVTGDLWQIGEHRLICGDCTDAAVVGRVMDNDKADMCFTSPPYNAGKNSGTGGYRGNDKRDVKDLYNTGFDDMTHEDYRSFLLLVLVGIDCVVHEDTPILWNVAYNANSRDDYGKVVFSDSNPFTVKESIVWDKGLGMNVAASGILSRTAEFVFLMSRGGKYKTNQESHDTYWNMWRISNKKDGGLDLHGASFPVELPSQGIELFSKKGAIVYEPFSGSGTTLVACQNLSRRGRAVEISTAYCAVTLERMSTAFPELEIKRIE